MKTTLFPLLSALSGLMRSRAKLHLEILALRQQLAMITYRDGRRLRSRRGERFFWVWLYRIWPDCLHTLRIFSPDTLVSWHRKGFRLYWRWKSRHRPGGRPPVPLEVRDLIRRLSRENLLWGAPRVHGELRMLGIEVSQTAVAKYMVRHRGPPSQNWRTFLHNHANDLVSIDFFTVPTATFRILYVLVVLSHERRQVMNPGRYTQLFFLDEATALAAGHRPCGECRWAEFVSFKNPGSLSKGWKWKGRAW